MVDISVVDNDLDIDDGALITLKNVKAVLAHCRAELRVTAQINVLFKHRVLLRSEDDNLMGCCVAYDDGTYVVSVLIGDEWIETLAHELYHVWEYENEVPVSEGLCNRYGERIAHAFTSLCTEV